MAYIADLVVKISAHTKSFESGIATATKTMGTITDASMAAVSTMSRLDTLTTSNLESNLTRVAADMKTLQGVTADVAPVIDVAQHKVAQMAAACALTTGALNLIGGSTSFFAASCAALTARLDYLWIKLGAVRGMLSPLIAVFGAIAKGAMAVTWPIRMIGGAVLAASKPFISIAMAVMTFRLSLKTMAMQLTWVKQLLGVLPLKVKLLLGTLLATGAAANTFGAAGRAAAYGMQLLLVPIVAIRSPLTALKMAAFSASQGFSVLRSSALSAATAVKTTAVAAIRSALSALMAFPRAVSGALGSLKMFAGIGLAGASIAALKLAANAESLQLQFKVLTGSAEAATKIMSELDAFAAETPFQKMEIGQAARQLIAFGSSADTVFNELRMIGDIAAATGQPIGELAELYGKAKVQGRLFGEDINQLTGRGIPIIQALAAQLGVADSEIKKLVASGAIGFPEMQKAMASMVGPTGKFGGMMAELSQTTAGKWSTFVDNVLLLGTAIGNEILPYANQLLDWSMSMVGGMDGVGTAFGSALKLAVDFGTGVFQTLTDIGTVIGVVAGSMGTVWQAMFEEIPKYAAAAFEWITANAGNVISNLGIMVQNLYAKINSAGMQLGEEIAFQLGLSDEVLNIAEATQQPMQELAAFKMPEAGVAATSLMEDIGRALEANRAVKEGITGQKQKTELGDLGIAPATTGAGKDKKAGSDTGKFAGAVQRGSAEAYSAIVASMRGGNEQVKATRDVSATIKREVGKPLQKLAGGNGAKIIGGFAT